MRDRGSISAVVSVRNCQKLPLYPAEPMPDGSKTDVSLPKAEPISDSGSATGNIFKRGEKLLSRRKMQPGKRKVNR